ncbi:MAG: hypothetical protein CW338_02030 [Clostridiales bacterium]|nr:hypothetical protein [Clostridiales bacterium]
MLPRGAESGENMGRKDELFPSPRRKKKGHAGRRFIVFLLILVILIAVCVLFNSINNGHVAMEKCSVTVPTLKDGLRILHISDLHGQTFGRDQVNLARSWKDENIVCSVVCITGDVIGADGNSAPFIDMLDKLPSSTTGYVFFIAGDEDPSPVIYTPHEGDSPMASWVLEAGNHGATYLDCPTLVTISGQKVWFCPEEAMNTDTAARRRDYQKRLDDAYAQEVSEERDAMIMYLNYHLDRLDRIDEARMEMSADHTYIVLTHGPFREGTRNSTMDVRVSGVSMTYPVALVLAGHLCGGQVRIPLLNIPVYADRDRWFPAENTVSGLHAVNGTYQYISPGLGSCREYPWYFSRRVFNEPAVTLLTLTRALK